MPADSRGLRLLVGALVFGRALLVGTSSLLFTLACGSEVRKPLAEGDEGQSGQTLVGGLKDEGHFSTVAVGNGLCTGSLISERTVLTAAHCADRPELVDAVYFGSSLNNALAKIPVKALHIHPGYVASTHRNDLMLVELEYSAPVPPVPLLRETLDNSPSFIGPPFTFVGFGRTVWIADNSGQKHVATFPISGIGPAVVGGQVGSIDETQFFYSRRGKHTCNGDSGGPSYVVRNGLEHVAGVTSFGEPFCRDLGVQARADLPAVTSFIQPVMDGIEANNHCRADEICDPTCLGSGKNWDPDCEANHCEADGVCALSCVAPVDPDCASLGVSHCIDDGVCDPTCATPDVDCG